MTTGRAVPSRLVAALLRSVLAPDACPESKSTGMLTTLAPEVPELAVLSEMPSLMSDPRDAVTPRVLPAALRADPGV